MIPYSTLGLLIIFAGAAFYTDSRRSIIPNWLNLAGAAVGLMNAAWLNGINGVLYSIVGLAGGFLSVLILHMAKAVEAGDVKMFAAMGALTGAEFVLYVLMHSIVIAAVYAIVILLFRKLLITTLMNAMRDVLLASSLRNWRFVHSITQSGKIRMPFMYAVVPGVIATWFYY